MKTSKTLSRLFPFYLVVLLLPLIILSCGSGPTNKKVINDVEQKLVSPAIDSPETKARFFQAWLSYCTSGLIASSEQVLLDTATTRINNAMQNDSIQKHFGKYGSSVAWGPELYATPSNGSYLTDNLMYILKAEESGSDTIQYAVGISGTNMISGYDWFQEDFRLDSLVDFPGGNTYGSKISLGTNRGIGILSKLTDQSQSSISADQFLLNACSDPSKVYKISVSGHSLGGALAPTYAFFLKKEMNINNKSNVIVESFPFAGPTPGNTVFADSLISVLNGYHAYNNELDVVPHAWDPNTLKELCSIYDDLTLGDQFPCDDLPITAGLSPVVGVIKYFRNISANGDYSIAGTPKTFVGQALKLGEFDCAGFLAAAEAVEIEQKPESLFNKLDSIIGKCNTPNIGTEFFVFSAYMAELGTQHTTAYYEQFITDETLTSIINKYVTGAESSWQSVIGEGVDGVFEYQILEQLLGEVNQNLQPNTDCLCP